MHSLTVRKALPGDAAAIEGLLGYYADQESLLRRSIDEIVENVRDFFVVEHNGAIAGCCALKVYSKDLAEIRSLAVSEKEQMQGAGKALLAACEAEAVDFGITNVFALTYIPDFFTKRGYSVTAKEGFPQKIWRDCFKCHQFPDCKETAVIRTLS